MLCFIAFLPMTFDETRSVPFHNRKSSPLLCYSIPSRPFRVCPTTPFIIPKVSSLAKHRVRVLQSTVWQHTRHPQCKMCKLISDAERKVKYMTFVEGLTLGEQSMNDVSHGFYPTNCSYISVIAFLREHFLESVVLGT